MMFQKAKVIPRFADLKGILAQSKQLENASYQTIETLIDRLEQFRVVTDENINFLKKSNGNGGNGADNGGGSPTTPLAHAPTHQPGGSDVLVNNAWLNTANTFSAVNVMAGGTAKQFEIQGSVHPAVTLRNTAEATGAKVARILYYQQKVRIDFTNDTESANVGGMATLDRNTGEFNTTGPLVAGTFVRAMNGQYIYAAGDSAAMVASGATINFFADAYGFVNKINSAFIVQFGLGEILLHKPLRVEGNSTFHGKVVIQDSADGGTNRGIYYWNAPDVNWVGYMRSTAGLTPGGNAGTNFWGVMAAHTIINREGNITNSGGFGWENNVEIPLMYLGGNGRLAVRGGANFGMAGAGAARVRGQDELDGWVSAYVFVSDHFYSHTGAAAMYIGEPNDSVIVRGTGQIGNIRIQGDSTVDPGMPWMRAAIGAHLVINARPLYLNWDTLAHTYMGGVTVFNNTAYPYTNGTYDFGGSPNRWRTIFLNLSPAGAGYAYVSTESSGALTYIPSSREFKKNDKPFDLEKSKKVLDLKPIYYQHLEMNENDPHLLGLMVDEIPPELNDLVSKFESITDEGVKKVETVHYDRIAVHLLLVMKDMQRRIDILEGKHGV